MKSYSADLFLCQSSSLLLWTAVYVLLWQTCARLKISHHYQNGTMFTEVLVLCTDGSFFAITFFILSIPAYDQASKRGRCRSLVPSLGRVRLACYCRQFSTLNVELKSLYTDIMINLLTLAFLSAAYRKVEFASRASTWPNFNQF